MRLSAFLACFLLFHALYSQESNYQSLIIDPALTKDANAVVRLNETTININAIDEMVVTKKRVVTVLNKLGNKHVRAMEWYDESEKIVRIQAVVYDNLGREINKYRQKDFEDVSAVSGGTLYSDSRVQYLNYTPISYPYTVEFSSETKTKNTGYLPSFYFLDNFLISSEVNKFTINFVSETVKPILKEQNFEGFKIKKTTSENSIQYLSKNIPAIKYEALSPNFGEVVPKVTSRLVNFYLEGYVGKIENWNDVGQWMHSNLINGRDELLEETKSKVHSLVNGIDSDLKKAKIIYKYVQENTRYISVQVGIGGMQPIRAIDVDKVKYGDCKGLSNYTMALLKEVGVTAYYTHVESGTEKISFESDFPSLAAGDHVILAIPYEDSYYWIDCTSQIHPFGFIGDFTDGRQVLVIKPEGGELVSTQAYINNENYKLTKANYTISNDNAIDALVTIKTKGIQYDNHFVLKEDKPEDVKGYYKSIWSNINNLKIEKFNFEDDNDQVEFLENVTIAAENYATKSGQRLLFSINPFNKNNNIPKRYRSRTLPLKIERGFVDEDQYKIQIPDGYTIEAMPEAKNIENEFGSYSVTYKVDELDNSINYNKKLFVKEGEYPKEKYKDYRDFRKKVAQIENSKIVLIQQ